MFIHKYLYFYLLKKELFLRWVGGIVNSWGQIKYKITALTVGNVGDQYALSSRKGKSVSKGIVIKSHNPNNPISNNNKNRQNRK